MSAAEIVHHSGYGVNIDQAAILRHLGLDPTRPETQALILVCERYGLDPILKHAVLIKDKVYITRDGLLHNAHQSGLLDGIELVDQGETDHHHTARVSVYRKDMSRPFTYPGRYPKNGANKDYQPEMAIKVAEVMALRRAFNITVPTVEEQWDLADQAPAPAPADEPQQPTPAPRAIASGGSPWAGWDATDWERWGRTQGVPIKDVQAATRIATWGDVANAPHDRQARVYALGEGGDE